MDFVKCDKCENGATYFHAVQPRLVIFLCIKHEVERIEWSKLEQLNFFCEEPSCLNIRPMQNFCEKHRKHKPFDPLKHA